MKSKPAETIDGYLAGFPPAVRKRLAAIRATIRRAVPDAVEAIAYQIPTFRLNGKNLIHFAGFAKHVGVYPAPRQAPEFAGELAAYAGGAGTVQFPHERPLPLDLVRRIVLYQVGRARVGAEKPAKSNAVVRARRPTRPSTPPPSRTRSRR
jgi:uncharacterized protein YdhG (YjbR/CyaY superfamily)